MADYKRMVSYMYQYENGVKKKNVGYARIEARNGQVKITIHLQLLGQLDSIFPTYLIHREKKGIDLFYLGDAILRNQVMDSRLTADENNIMNSGHKLSEIGGLLLFMHDNVFFGTEWDDMPIVAKDVLEALSPKKKESEAGEESDAEDEPDAEDKPDAWDDPEAEDKPEEIPESEEESNKDDEAGFEEESDTEGESDFEDGMEFEGEPEYEDELTGLEETQGDLTAAGIGSINLISEMPEPLSPEGLSLAEEINMPKYKMPRGWKTIERLQRATAAEVSKEESLFQEQAEPVFNEMDIPVNQPSANNESDQPDYQPEYIEDSPLEETPKLAEDMEENQVAMHLFNNYPRIYPFEDNEIILCVKIEPKDIGMLPKDLWALSNNSFLMHGFYCYHHLIFAKLKDRYGCRYILGIPGIYHNRERFMARMFGFESFKSIRRRELQQGDFGYWYLDVNF